MEMCRTIRAPLSTTCEGGPNFPNGDRTCLSVRPSRKAVKEMRALPAAQELSRNCRAQFSPLTPVAEAVRRESAQAICHWWGVGFHTVWRWRKALGVEPATEGTCRLHRAHSADPRVVASLAKAQSKTGDPERRAKIAAARRGKPRPPHVGQAVAEAHRGTRHSEVTRRKMSESHKKRWARERSRSEPLMSAERKHVQAAAAALGHSSWAALSDHGECLQRLLGEIPQDLWHKVRHAVATKYEGLEARYGKTMAVAILSAGILGAAVPVPGTSFVAAAPLIGLAGLHHRLTAGGGPTGGALAEARLAEEEIGRLGWQWLGELVILVEPRHAGHANP